MNYTTRFSTNRALLFGNAGNQNLTLEINAEVDGCVDVDAIAEKFATYFEKCYSCNKVKQKTSLESEYSRLRHLRANYAGFPTANELVLTQN